MGNVAGTYLMSQRIEFVLEGNWPEGMVLTTCGKNDICLKETKDLLLNKVTALPPVPKNIVKNSRVRLSLCDGAPCWDVRPPKETQAAWYSGGFSLLTLIVTIWIVRRLMNRWEGK